MLMIFDNMILSSDNNNTFRNHKPIATIWEKNGYEINHHFEFEPPLPPPPVLPSNRPPAEPPVVNRRHPVNNGTGNTSQFLSNHIDLTAETAPLAGIRTNQPPIPMPNPSANLSKPQQPSHLNMPTNIGSKRPSVSPMIYIRYL